MAVFLSWSRLRRRMFICRLLACTITGSLILLLLLSPAVSSQPTQAAANRHHEATHARARPHVPVAQEESIPIARPQVRIQEQNEETFSPRQKYSTSGAAPRHSSAIDLSKDSTFIQQVMNLSSFIPDESRTNALLGPLPAAGGTALLRDLALKTRVFREAFAAWESLHLITSPTGQITLQNVIQRIRLSSNKIHQAIETYDRFRVFINAFAMKLFPWVSPYFADHMLFHASFYGGGRGLVFTAGTHQAEYLRTSIPALRRLGCDLPIEIMYLGDDDLSEDAREGLEELEGVVTRDISSMVDDGKWTLKGWAAKPFAMLYSSFREVIFIDADALFLTNPSNLFSDSQYLQTGALFFKDRTMMPESKKSWLRKVLPKPLSHHIKENRLWTGESGHMQDSGVVVVDKWRHFVSLLLATRLNGPDRDGDKEAGKKGVYEMVYGDKETFWLSWELAGDLEYAFHDGSAGTMGVLRRPGEIQDEEFEDEDEYEWVEEDEEEEEEPEPPAPKPDLKRSAVKGEVSPADSAHTICSPQLLHLDRRGKPIWFNGWLATKKFDNLKFRPFEAYMREPVASKHRKDAWELKGNNIVCLTSEEYFDFSREEERVLNGLLEAAEKNYVERKGD